MICIDNFFNVSININIVNLKVLKNYYNKNINLFFNIYKYYLHEFTMIKNHMRFRNRRII